MRESFPRLDVKAAALAGGALGVLAFVICVAFGLLFPASGPMRQLMEAALPGFTWLTLGGSLIGVVESSLYGAVGAGLAAAFYNFFAMGPGNRTSPAR
jgi:hypothetical protein